MAKKIFKNKGKTIAKPFPGKVVLGKSMIEKFNHAKKLSSSIGNNKKLNERT